MSVYFLQDSQQMKATNRNKANQENHNHEIDLYPLQFVSEFLVELKYVSWRNYSVAWLFVKNPIFRT
jgi:hypothetical protein